MYQKWIKTYSGNEYQNLAKEVGKFYDNCVTSRLGNNFKNTYKWKVIKNKFKTATLLEVDFWEMSYE